MTLALGAEYREDKYEIKPGDPESRYKEGSQSYPGFALTDAGKYGRHSYAAYANVALQPTEPLKIDLATRYEHFSDFGDTIVFKGRAATTSGHVRRPGHGQHGLPGAHAGRVLLLRHQRVADGGIRQLPPNSAAAALVGGNGLDAEKSRNFSVGFVTHPGYGITATLDLYQITVKDRIVGSGSLFGSGGSVNIPACARHLGQRQRAGSHGHPDRHHDLHQCLNPAPAAPSSYSRPPPTSATWDRSSGR